MGGCWRDWVRWERSGIWDEEADVEEVDECRGRVCAGLCVLLGVNDWRSSLVSSSASPSVEVSSLTVVHLLVSRPSRSGDRYEREGNICRSRSNLDGLLSHGEEGQEARHLVEQMIRPDSSERFVASHSLSIPALVRLVGIP